MSEPLAAAQVGIGLAAFDSLHAEAEPWLDHYRVDHPEFELIAGNRSYLVIGGEGAGKTALFQALCARLEVPTGDAAPDHLVVRWRPAPLKAEAVGKAAAESQLRSVLAACADNVLAHLARWPAALAGAPEDVQSTLAWFVCHHLAGELGKRLAVHAGPAPAEGHEMIYSLPSRVQAEEWLSSAEPNEVVSEFVTAVRAIGLQMVYVLVDPDNLGDSRYLSRDLEGFLASLSLFENPRFVYKIILPEHLMTSLDEAMAVDRRRIQLCLLTWSPEDLARILLQRIRLAAGTEILSLQQVCQDPKLATWLERTGGDCPRGWLQSATPLMVRYLRQRRSIEKREWLDIRKNPPPALRLDVEQATITVGWRRVTKVSEIPLALFAYLFENRGRLCSRQEIYQRAYLPTTYPDSAHDSPPDYPTEYDHVLDSTISRLRKLIEPDPGSPLFLITERGKGYRLDNVR